ncbi:MAG: hypothetical protein C4537_03140 [Acholeplasma sp.]|jgi:hypothetical protein|nr:MAG: hypothetical protein C4537_03140 [Acholeplasma sp.]
MKSLINRIDQWIHRYKQLQKIIDKETRVKGVTKSVLGGLLISVLILLIPALAVINMFIYTKLTFFLAMLLSIMVILWPYLYYSIYFRLLKVYYPKLNDVNTRIPLVMEATLISIVLTVIVITVLSTLF